MAGAVGHNLVDRAYAAGVGVGDKDIAGAIDGHAPWLAEAVANLNGVGIRGERTVAVGKELPDYAVAIIRHKKIAGAVEGQGIGTVESERTTDLHRRPRAAYQFKDHALIRIAVKHIVLGIDGHARRLAFNLRVKVGGRGEGQVGELRGNTGAR